MSKRLWIRAGTLITPRTSCQQVTILVEEDRIAGLWPGAAPAPCPGEPVLDADGQFVGPGFVDLHVHGGGGFDTMDATTEAVLGLAAFHARHGSTSLLPSTVAASDEEIHAALAAVEEAMGTDSPGARVLGAHVEGPFLSHGKRGAHAARHVRPPNRERDTWLFEHQAAIRRLTLAPELPGALELIRQLRQMGILVSLGHSAADEALVAEAILAGAGHVTHLFNAMSTLGKVGAVRRLGLAEVALVRDDLTVEVIADGFHFPLALLPLVVRAKGAEGVALVTDAMRAAGLPDGRYTLGEMMVTVQGGMAISDEGGLAGSIATMDQLLRNAVQRAGQPLARAWQMASLTPARILSAADHLGEVAVGKTADLVILDPALQVVATLVGGQVVYRR